MILMTLAGRIGKTAETRNTQGGKAVTSFPVAVDVGWGDSKRTQWVDCAMWGERGQKLAQYLTKGSQVTVHGLPTVRAYDKNGPQAAMGCMVNEITLQGGGEKAQGGYGQQGGGYEPAEGLDDSIPFLTSGIVSGVDG